MASPDSFSQTLIPAATDAETTQKVAKIRQEALPATLFATGLAGVEVATVFISPDGGGTFEAMFQGGTAVELTATNNIISINSPMTIGVTKDATASAAGVFLNSGPRA